MPDNAETLTDAVIEVRKTYDEEEQKRKECDATSLPDDDAPLSDLHENA